MSLRRTIYKVVRKVDGKWISACFTPRHPACVTYIEGEFVTAHPGLGKLYATCSHVMALEWGRWLSPDDATEIAMFACEAERTRWSGDVYFLPSKDVFTPFHLPRHFGIGTTQTVEDRMLTMKSFWEDPKAYKGVKITTTPDVVLCDSLKLEKKVATLGFSSRRWSIL